MFSNQISQWNDLKGKIGATQSLLSQCLEFLQTYRDVDGKRIAAFGLVNGQIYSLTDAITVAQRGLKVLASIKLKNGTPVPRDALTTSNAVVVRLHQAALDFAAQVQTAKLEGQPLRWNLAAQLVRPNGEIPCNFAPAADQLVAATDDALNTAARLAIGTALQNGESGVSEIVEDEVAHASSAANDAEAASRAAADALQELRALFSETQQIKATIEQNLEKIDSDIAAREAALDDAVEKISATSVKTSSDSAVASSKLDEITRIEAKSKDADQELTQFQTNLDSVKSKLQASEQTTSEVIANNAEQTERIRQLIADAEDMVSAATVAGLAKAFGDERDDLDKALKSAANGFYFGIAILGAPPSR